MGILERLERLSCGYVPRREQKYCHLFLAKDNGFVQEVEGFAHLAEIFRLTLKWRRIH